MIEVIFAKVFDAKVIYTQAELGRSCVVLP